MNYKGQYEALSAGKKRRMLTEWKSLYGSIRSFFYKLEAQRPVRGIEHEFFNRWLSN